MSKAEGSAAQKKPETPSRKMSMFVNLISRFRHDSQKEKSMENKPEFLPPPYNHKLTKFNHLRYEKSKALSLEKAIIQLHFTGLVSTMFP